MTYPVTNNSALTNAEILTCGYDSMGRPVSLTSNNGPADVMKNMQNDYTAPAAIVQNVQYDYAGRMTGLQYLAGETSTGVGVYTQESMSYNVSGQLASLGWGNPAGQSASNYSAIGAPTGGVGYTWSATQNNGQITQAVDTISGETITYIYDALKRLTSASSTKPWTQTFQYDGFGNLTAKVLNGASTPIPVNPANNRLSNATYDANGNMTSGAGASLAYDEANRLTSAAETSGGIEYYGYSPDNKRVYHQLANGTGEWIFYSPQGERMGIYTFNSSTGWSTVSTNVWFAGKLISDENGAIFQDRLGTNRASGARFYPYGDEVASTANDHEKFATYTRDSYTGLDYADQRFFASIYGRFNTPDPYQASGGPDEPASWNRYAYTRGDPINRVDPRGLEDCDTAYSLIEGCTGDPNDYCGSNPADPECIGESAPGDAICDSNPTVIAFDQVDSSGCFGGASVYPVSTPGSPPPTCGQANPDGNSAEQIELTVLFGEDSWTLGYIASVVAQEDMMMINVMVNQTIESHGKDTQTGVMNYVTTYATTRFLGLDAGQAKLASAVASSTDSSACQHLATAEAAFGAFWSNGGKPFAPYNQWRSIGTVPTQGLILQSTIIAGTAFYNIFPLRPIRVRAPR